MQQALATTHLLALLTQRLRPPRFFEDVADGLERVSAGIETPILLGIDTRGILDDLATLLRRAGALADGRISRLDLDDLPAIGRIPALRLEDTSATEILVHAGCCGHSIFLIWRDLDAELWPDELKLVPDLLHATLSMMFKQIETQSRGTIKADVFWKIQTTIDQATTLVMHIDLVIPSFIVEIFGKDPDYREQVVLKGRTILISSTSTTTRPTTRSCYRRPSRTSTI